ncbi:MAG: 8-oxo-dGTP diphosphatase [Gammaproteobacteria bacterium]|jgi:8-oxo-dGTP diphosphatase
MQQDFKFCPQCACTLDKKPLHGVERFICAGCGFIFWRNPIVGVAVIARQGDTILLGRRARGEYSGQWCIPCGYVECDEHVRAAAQREFLEETGLIVDIGDVYTVHSNFHNPKVQTVGIWFNGVVTGGVLAANDDLEAVEYVPLGAMADLPLAFPTDALVLEQLRNEHRDATPLRHHSEP